LNATDVAPVKPVPEIVTAVPTWPLVGVNDETVGTAGAVTVKLDELVPVPAEVVTAIGPDVALDGTVAAICVPELTVKLAAVPLKVTDVAPVKLVPVIVTDVPGGAFVGLNDVTVGADAGAVLQPGRVNDPMRVFQLSAESVVGSVS
jgi:hypothetical protein